MNLRTCPVCSRLIVPVDAEADECIDCYMLKQHPPAAETGSDDEVQPARYDEVS